MSSDPFNSAAHYDHVTEAWSLLLGDDLHYGLFESGSEELPSATAALTRLMADAAAISAGVRVLDVGCGTGAPACFLASELGASVTAITTSRSGLERARSRVAAAGIADKVRCELRDGMSNGFADASFDRVWVLESSHLMRPRSRLIGECARVLRAQGVLALCDIMLRRQLELLEVRALRDRLVLLRDVFGDSHMEPLSVYAELVQAHGLTVTRQLDLTSETRPTFGRWRENAHRNRSRVVELIGQPAWRSFLDASVVLEDLWDEEVLGYGLIAAQR